MPVASQLNSSTLIALVNDHFSRWKSPGGGWYWIQWLLYY